VLAVLNRPRLIILDELTQGLDPAARRDVWEAIGVLRDAGTTVLLVTHYMDEAQALCDRVVVMRSGQVLDAGTPDQLVLRHAPWATVRFGSAGPATDRMRVLPGVTSVDVVDSTVEVRGDRAMIAHVCAELVRDGVPADLTVVMPDLESAMVALLTNDSSPELHSTPAFSGGTR
jgi:ABC-2 type transport system ATP-binding protein